MARTRPSLWEAAKVKTHGTLERWSNAIRSTVVEPSPGTGLNITDVKQRISNFYKEKTEPLMRTFSKSIKANPHQRAILKDILLASNITYNWCCCLYSTGSYGDKLSPKNLDTYGIRQRDLDTGLFAKIAAGAKPPPDDDLVYPGARRLFEPYDGREIQRRARIRGQTERRDDP